MKYMVILVLALSLAGPLLGAQGFSSLEEQMTGKEFTDAGLDKLTDQELQALNNWIRRHSPGALDAPGGAVPTAAAEEGSGDRRGFDDSDGDDDRPIQSRITGPFNGWDGETIFKLENGMIWAQADKDKVYIEGLRNPEVTIAKSLFGRWHLNVDGHDEKCRVRRIQ